MGSNKQGYNQWGEIEGGFLNTSIFNKRAYLNALKRLLGVLLWELFQEQLSTL